MAYNVKIRIYEGGIKKIRSENHRLALRGLLSDDNWHHEAC